MPPPVDMTKERAALRGSVVAEQDPFFIALGGPKAHGSSGRDDKGESGASSEGSCWYRTRFSSPWVGRRPMTPPVEMTKGRAALPATVVAEQKPFSSPWVGRRPMTPPVEMTKGRAALPATVVAEQKPFSSPWVGRRP